MSLFDNDPGINNKFPKNSSGAFDTREFLTALSKEIENLPADLIEEVRQLLETTINNGSQIFFAGNGGSFAIAEHMVCDYAKGMKRFYPSGVKAINLGSNHPLNSALTNDFGHDHAYQAELEMYAQEGDTLIAISSSGNSKNILNSVEYAKKNKIKTVGLSGFGGGELCKTAEISFVSSQTNYPAIEAAHQIFLDCVAFSLWK